MTARRSLLAVVCAVFGSAMLLASCGKDEPAPTAANKPVTTAAPPAVEFTVLATSDLKDVQPLEDMVLKATGVQIRRHHGKHRSRAER
jgi:Ca-activated chloride channel homolog